MNEISKMIVFATFCLGLANVSHAEEYKAIACYDKPSANIDRFLQYEIILGSEGLVDGLKNDASGSTTVTTSTVTWRFTGNYYSWEIFAENFRYYVDENYMVIDEGWSYEKTRYCDQVDATLLRIRIRKIKAAKKLF